MKLWDVNCKINYRKGKMLAGIYFLQIIDENK